MSKFNIKPYNANYARKCFLEIMNNDKISWDIYSKHYIDKKLSITLYDNKTPVGIYVLGRSNPVDFILEEKEAIDTKIIILKKLNKFKNKNGIHGILLYVNPNYRKQKLGKILLDYANGQGDYIWGGHAVHLNNIKYWLKRREIIAKMYTKNKNNRYELISYYTLANLS